MESRRSIILQRLEGDDEEYMSDGLPMNEKEVFLPRPEQEDHRTIVPQVTFLQKSAENEPKQKPKKKKEVIVDVREEEIADEDALFKATVPPSHPIIENLVNESPQVSKDGERENNKITEAQKDLKINISAAEASYHQAREKVSSPSIKVLDENNHVKQFIEAFEVEGEKESEDSEHSDKVSPEHEHHIMNPDRCRDQEALERYIHEDDHEDETKLNVHEIVEHPEHFEHHPHEDKEVHLRTEEDDEERQCFDSVGQERPQVAINRETVGGILEREIDSASKHINERHSQGTDGQNPISFAKNDENEEEKGEVGDTPKWGLGNQLLEGLQGDAQTKQAALEQIENEYTKKINSLMNQAEKLREEGNELFEAQEYEKARGKYSKVFAFTRGITNPTASGADSMINIAIKAAEKGHADEDIKAKARLLERDVNSNLAMVYLLEENWNKAIEKATNSLNIEKTPKSYFRRGKAYAMKNEFENAYKDFEEGKLLEDSESHKVFDDEIAKTKQKEKEYIKDMQESSGGFLKE